MVESIDQESKIEERSDQYDIAACIGQSVDKQCTEYEREYLERSLSLDEHQGYNKNENDTCKIKHYFD